jgi:NDP-sugar pyrophosphorylase family protein
MLLAAGRSTRLGSLGQVLPKPLLPICGYPAICFGLASLAAAGIREVVVNLHHHGEMIRAALGDGAAFGVRVLYSEEPELLGTAGGLAQARPLFAQSDAVVVVNAKVVADVDIREVVAAHRTTGADATMVLRDVPDARRWGAISADATGRVVRILDAESPHAPSGPVVERMFTGIQVLGPAVLDRLRPVFSDSIREGYIPALQAGAEVRAFVLPGYFAEHSTPRRYLDGNLALLRRPDLVRAAPGPLVGVDGAARVAAGARLVPPFRIAAGAVVEDGAVVGPEAALGAGARVAAGVSITRSVLWPGTIAHRSLADAVLTADGAVEIAASA